MAKKEAKKKFSSKSVKKPGHSKKENISPEKTLIENFVAFQSVMADLSMKLDKVATQMANLLELFEKSAKTIAEKDFGSDKEDKNARKIIEKLDDLLDQNKTIAKGLTLLHEKEGNFQEDEPGQENQEEQPPKPGQKSEAPKPQEGQKSKSIDMGQYQKSISSNTEEDLSRTPPSDRYRE